MKSLVLVTTRFPWPLTNGFANKNYWMLSGLSKNYRIFLHVVQRSAVSSNDKEKVRAFCERINVYRPNLFDIVLGILVCLIRDQPLQLSLYFSRKAKKNIKSNLKGADLAISSVIRGFQYFDGYHGPIFCDLADSLGQLYLRDFINFTGVRRYIYREEGRRMLKYERQVVQKSNQTFFFNPNEAISYPLEKVTVVPHGVQPTLFQVSGFLSEYANSVVIFGKMNYEPNVNAVEWFLNNVFPKLPSEINLHIIGADPCLRILRLPKNNPRIIVKGFLDNPYIALRSAIANLCPIQIGGGIQNKVIEGLAVEALNFVSPLAARPFQDLESSGIVVCDTPADWVRQITVAFNSPDDFKFNRIQGRQYASHFFSWATYARKIDECLMSNC